MGGRGSANTRNSISNKFKSSFGFENVGEQQEFKTMSGISTKGTVTPETADIQAYLDSGKFDNYGNNARAKKLIVKEIIRDMRGRGYDISPSEDDLKFLPEGSTGLAISLGKRSDRWVVKQSNSAGSVTRGGIRGALDRIERRKK